MQHAKDHKDVHVTRGKKSAHSWLLTYILQVFWVQVLQTSQLLLITPSTLCQN